MHSSVHTYDGTVHTDYFSLSEGSQGAIYCDDLHVHLKYLTVVLSYTIDNIVDILILSQFCRSFVDHLPIIFRSYHIASLNRISVI